MQFSAAYKVASCEFGNQTVTPVHPTYLVQNHLDPEDSLKLDMARTEKRRPSRFA